MPSMNDIEINKSCQAFLAILKPVIFKKGQEFSGSTIEDLIYLLYTETKYDIATEVVSLCKKIRIDRDKTIKWTLGFLLGAQYDLNQPIDDC
jgi:hypothetical protein